MKRIVYTVMTLICLVTTANADIYDDCENAISANNTDKVKSLSATIQEMDRIPVANLIAARLCVSAAIGEPMVFVKKTKSFITLAEFEGRNAQKALSEAEKAAERIALEKLKSDLVSTIAVVEKRAACVDARSFKINDELEAISKQFEQRNEQLIFDDTHQACTKLYSSDKSAAMLNQNCIAAFQRMGHPNLVFSEAELRATFIAELSGLVTLRASLKEELMEAKAKLLEAEGVVTEEGFNQQIANDLEAKSCAEFGYEGVYLD